MVDGNINNRQKGRAREQLTVNGNHDVGADSDVSSLGLLSASIGSYWQILIALCLPGIKNCLRKNERSLHRACFKTCKYWCMASHLTLVVCCQSAESRPITQTLLSLLSLDCTSALIHCDLNKVPLDSFIRRFRPDTLCPLPLTYKQAPFLVIRSGTLLGHRSVVSLGLLF